MTTSNSTKAPTIPTWLTDEQGWALWPIMSWLLEDGRGIDKIDALVLALAERLLEAGAPLWRLRLSMRTLHPLTVAWRPSGNATAKSQCPFTRLTAWSSAPAIAEARLP